MMNLTFGLFTQVSDSGPDGPLVFYTFKQGFHGQGKTYGNYFFLGQVKVRNFVDGHGNLERTWKFRKSQGI